MHKARLPQNYRFCNQTMHSMSSWLARKGGPDQLCLVDLHDPHRCCPSNPKHHRVSSLSFVRMIEDTYPVVAGIRSSAVIGSSGTCIHITSRCTPGASACICIISRCTPSGPIISPRTVCSTSICTSRGSSELSQEVLSTTQVQSNHRYLRRRSHLMSHVER